MIKVVEVCFIFRNFLDLVVSDKKEVISYYGIVDLYILGENIYGI